MGAASAAGGAAGGAAGKGKKLKKAKERKYADQDEEDRLLAMQLLGSAGLRFPPSPSQAVPAKQIFLSLFSRALCVLHSLFLPPCSP